MKRTLDLTLSILGLAVLWPLFLGIALAILAIDGPPVFFRQERVRRHGGTFKIWKFRTMVRNAEKVGGQLTVGSDSRITRVGRLLRRTKLDELPQLLNVLNGEMSLVGPRPEVPKYVACYSVDQRRVLQLAPGITDPASIRFRNESELLAKADDPHRAYIERILPEKIRLNLEYAARANCFTDLVVLLQTVARLIR